MCRREQRFVQLLDSLCEQFLQWSWSNEPTQCQEQVSAGRPLSSVPFVPRPFIHPITIVSSLPEAGNDLFSEFTCAKKKYKEYTFHINLSVPLKGHWPSFISSLQETVPDFCRISMRSCSNWPSWRRRTLSLHHDHVILISTTKFPEMFAFMARPGLFQSARTTNKRELSKIIMIVPHQVRRQILPAWRSPVGAQLPVQRLSAVCTEPQSPASFPRLLRIYLASFFTPHLFLIQTEKSTRKSTFQVDFTFLPQKQHCCYLTNNNFRVGCRCQGSNKKMWLTSALTNQRCGFMGGSFFFFRESLLYTRRGWLLLVQMNW